MDGGLSGTRLEANMDLTELGASEAAAAIRAGEIASEQLVSACLARIEAVEDRVRA